MPEFPVPKTEIEKDAARTALEAARTLLEAEVNPIDAAGFACLDCPEWHGWVLAVLNGERSLLRDISTVKQAAAVTRRTHGAQAKEQALRRAARADSKADVAFWRDVAALL